MIGKGKWIEDVLKVSGSIRDIQNLFHDSHPKISLQPENPGIEPIYKSFGLKGNLSGDFSDLVLSSFNLVKKYQFGSIGSFSNKFPYFLLPSDTVLFKKHPANQDYLFVVHPAIEKFLLNELSELNKKPSDYDLPDEFIDFRKK
ncbi:MAG: hypothetical protein R3C61_10455 [Bacteroidia bacterium]